MTVSHQTGLVERIQRLESEIGLEKKWHQNHLKMLEETLRESSCQRQTIVGLEETIKKMEAEIEILKKGSPMSDMQADKI